MREVFNDKAEDGNKLSSEQSLENKKISDMELQSFLSYHSSNLLMSDI